MPQQAWSKKRERQYEHIKDNAKDRGEPTKTAERIAAATVINERARSGDSRTASRPSRHDIAASRRGGLRSHSGAAGRTKEQLSAEAQRGGIKGRSMMTNAQLQRAVAGAG